MRLPYAMAGYYTLEELTRAGVWLYLILALLLSAGIVWKRVMPLIKYTVIIGILALGLVVAAWGVAMRETRANSYAVVIVAAAEAKFAPADTAVTYFKLSEGTKIKVVGKSEQWRRVKTPDAKLGWVPAAAIEPI